MILTGEADDCLLDHINTMESFYRLSPGERRTLDYAYLRLDQLTDPNKTPPSGVANALAAVLAEGISR